MSDLHGIDRWIARGHDVDETPPTCADCNRELGSGTVRVRDSRRGDLRLCPPCGEMYLAYDAACRAECAQATQLSKRVG